MAVYVKSNGLGCHTISATTSLSIKLKLIDGSKWPEVLTGFYDAKVVIFILFQFKFCLQIPTCSDNTEDVFLCIIWMCNERSKSLDLPEKHQTDTFWYQRIFLFRLLKQFLISTATPGQWLTNRKHGTDSVLLTKALKSPCTFWITILLWFIDKKWSWEIYLLLTSKSYEISNDITENIYDILQQFRQVQQPVQRLLLKEHLLLVMKLSIL